MRGLVHNETALTPVGQSATINTKRLTGKNAFRVHRLKWAVRYFSQAASFLAAAIPIAFP